MTGKAHEANETTKRTPIDDCYTSRLSDAFYHATDNPSLELIVTTFNVNAGHNTKLMSHCQILKEYSIYVAKVRSFTEQMPLDDAVQKAVTECIQENILADFLRKNQAEVIAMSIFEYDEKAVRQVYYEDGLQAGRKDGIKTGILNMLRAKKYSLEEISEVFQVPVEEIEQIKNQQM